MSFRDASRKRMSEACDDDMTLVIYEPGTPAIEIIGHAGAAPRGRDPVCAALSILMYTLIDAEKKARIYQGDGYCRIEADRFFPTKADGHKGRDAYEIVAGGFRLLAENYPRYVRFEVKR